MKKAPGAALLLDLAGFHRQRAAQLEDNAERIEIRHWARTIKPLLDALWDDAFKKTAPNQTHAARRAPRDLTSD